MSAVNLTVAKILIIKVDERVQSEADESFGDQLHRASAFLKRTYESVAGLRRRRSSFAAGGGSSPKRSSYSGSDEMTRLSK